VNVNLGSDNHFDTIGARDVFSGGPSFLCPSICLSL
jgi:hypothetical protein